MRRTVVLTVVGIAAVVGQALVAQAYINPNFTPPMLVEQSNLIAQIKLGAADAKGKVTATITETLKGKSAEPTVPLDLSTSLPDIMRAAVEHMKANGDKPALLFAGEYKEEKSEEPPVKCAYVHCAGKWFYFLPGEKVGWELDVKGYPWSHMEGTWAGGTDMLLRETRYLLKVGAAGDCPVAVGVTWTDSQKVGRLPGKARFIRSVDFGSDPMVVFVATEAGDKLYQWQKDGLKEITAARKLASKSKEAVWVDLNGDGKVDLVSWDGAALVLHTQGADGTFSAAPIKTSEAVKDCLGLAVLDSGTKGKPALVVTTKASPLLLLPGKDGAMDAKALTDKPLDKDLGDSFKCLIADLDGDNVGDILQLCGKASLFFKGTGGTAFATPVKWPVGAGVKPGAADVGDFDQDGRLDIVVAAEDFCKLYHNRAVGVWDEIIGNSGEIAYISKPDAIYIQTCDVNNDGRQDIFIAYSTNAPPHVFFNRGFRSTGHAHDLAIEEHGLVEEALQGQQAGLIADATGDGAQDMVIVTPAGDLWLLIRSNDSESANTLQTSLVPGGAFAGPLTVTAYRDDRDLGAWNLVAGSAWGWICRPDAGEVELRWQFPGAQPQKKKVTLENKSQRITLEPGPAVTPPPSK